MLRFILGITLTIAALCFFTLGLDWIEIGQGLHPAIAFPIAALCTAAVAFILYLEMSDYHVVTDDEIERYMSDEHQYRLTDGF